MNRISVFPRWKIIVIIVGSGLVASHAEMVVSAVGQNMLPLVGSTCPFTWTIADGQWHHKGTLKVGSVRQEVDEIWEPVP